MDKNTAMITWLGNCPSVTKLFSLFGDVSEGVNLLTRLADNTNVIREYVDGGKYCSDYSEWTLICYCRVAHNYQPANSSENLLTYAEIESICEWINTKRNTHDFPAIDGVQDVECIPSNPVINGVDQNGIAKYTIGIRVTFEGRYVH